MLHNRKVTGRPWQLPYQLAQARYGVPQSFLWQKEIPEPDNLNPRQREMYLWQERNTPRRAPAPARF